MKVNIFIREPFSLRFTIKCSYTVKATLLEILFYLKSCLIFLKLYQEIEAPINPANICLGEDILKTSSV